MKTQWEQVYDAMEKNGGYATFNQLNQMLDFSLWKSKTPEASVRGIVQTHKQFSKLKPGLWCLSKYKEKLEKEMGFIKNDGSVNEDRNHAYYQGVIIEIGNMYNKDTYIPPQDKNKKFLNNKLGEMTTIEQIYDFTSYKSILNRAKTVDVIWFNERKMPEAFYEVEHTTDICNSLDKFYELQDFYATFSIVANKSRFNEFKSKIERSIYSSIRDRIKFVEYEKLANQYNAAMVPRII